MIDKITVFLIGIAAGLLIAVFMYGNVGLLPKAAELRQECELPLARTEVCEMVFIPVKKGGF